jgi:hypothetical protein
VATLPPFTSSFAYPLEGLTYLLNAIPKATQAEPTTIYCGLFTTAWSTVQGYTGTIDINLNGTGSTVIELASTGYARQSIANTLWGTVGTTTATIGANTLTVANVATTSQIAFANTSGSTWTAVNGIFLAVGSSAVGNKSVSQGGATTVLYYSQFSDLSSVTIANNDTLYVTPNWQLAPYPA